LKAKELMEKVAFDAKVPANRELAIISDFINAVIVLVSSIPVIKPPKFKE
jgi:hypothetical protein